jgi:hypothetical protein
MANKTAFAFIKNTLGIGLIKLGRTYKKNNPEILGKVGSNLINWIVNGSSRSSVVPPIKTGILRGSGSVFVGKKFIGVTEDLSGRGTPNREHSGKRNEVTVGFNTAYAAIMHENLAPAGTYQPQPLKGKDSPNADIQGQFITAHLQADGKASIAFYAKLLKKVLG